MNPDQLYCLIGPCSCFHPPFCKFGNGCLKAYSVHAVGTFNEMIDLRDEGDDTFFHSELCPVEKIFTHQE